MTRPSLIALAAGIVLAAPTPATAQTRPITTTRLSEHLYLLSVDEMNYSTNTLVLTGPDGVLIVDTQKREDGPALRAAVAALGGPVRYIVNTHRHIEHVGGNEAFDVEPVVIGHALLPEKLRSRSFLFEEFPPATFPDITVADSLTLFFNGERIRLVAVPGSHDDHELMVHFTGANIVHLSSLTNGFNLPSVDDDGDVLAFPAVIDRAASLLPRDVRIISGHSPRGIHELRSWSDLRPYRDMIARTIDIVRAGLARGRDVAALQRDSVLREFGSYAGSYVGEDDWIEEVADRLRRPAGPRPPFVFADLHATWKSQGAAAAVARYTTLRRDHAAEYRFGENDLLVAGMKVLPNHHAADAVTFLEGSLREYPAAPLRYMTHLYLALAHRELGNVERAREQCRRALEVNPRYERASQLLAELGGR